MRSFWEAFKVSRATYLIIGCQYPTFMFPKPHISVALLSVSLILGNFRQSLKPYSQEVFSLCTCKIYLFYFSFLNPTFAFPKLNICSNPPFAYLLSFVALMILAIPLRKNPNSPKIFANSTTRDNTSLALFIFSPPFCHIF